MATNQTEQQARPPVPAGNQYSLVPSHGSGMDSTPRVSDNQSLPHNGQTK